MINDKTVLVLGAGASSHLNFPTGDKLAEKMCKQIHTNSLLHMILAEKACSISEAKEVAKLLEDSDIETPDFVFARDERLTDIGKALIAWTIGSYEDINKLHTESQTIDPLYKYIWNQLHTVDKEEFANNKLKVITFNYDRSFEKYIQWQMELAYNYDELNAFKEREKIIPVKHVHGQLGTLNISSGKLLHRYGDRWNAENNSMKQDELEHFRSISNQIKIATEASKDDPEFKAAQEWLSEANSVIFLGCAYHDMNMLNLGVEDCLRAPTKIYACTYGLGRGQIYSNLAFVARLLDKKNQILPTEKAKNIIEIGNPNHMATEFMKESVWFDTTPREARYLREIIKW